MAIIAAAPEIVWASNSRILVSLETTGSFSVCNCGSPVRESVWISSLPIRAEGMMRRMDLMKQSPERMMETATTSDVRNHASFVGKVTPTGVVILFGDENSEPGVYVA